MRLAVLLLVVANFVVWGIARTEVGQGSGAEPERLAQQIEPQRLKILSRGEPPPLPAGHHAEPMAAVPPPELACLSYSDLSDETADALVPIITRRAPDLMVARDRGQVHVNGFRVQIDRLGSRAHAERKAGELRDLGVSDYTIVGGGGVWVVSLGVFANEAGAKARLAQLRKKGVRSADTLAITYPDNRVRVTVSGDAASVDRASTAVREERPELSPEVCEAPPASASAPSLPASGST